MDKAFSFTDAEGRDWYPRIDGRIVRDYDRRLVAQTGQGFFAICLDLFSDVEPTDAGTPLSTKSILGLSKKLFGRLEDLQFLLYQACSDDPRIQKRGRKYVSFDAFCSAIRGKAVVDAIKVAIALLVDYFPDLDEADNDDGPFEGLALHRGTGKGSTRSRR